MSEEFNEYITFFVKDKNGKEIEMAVVDEFEYEHKHYVVGAIVENDMINEDGMYIYKSKIVEDNFDVEKITDPSEYEKIAKAYLEL